MKLYLDDDIVGGRLIALLRKAGHDVQIPADLGLSGRNDQVHLRYAVQAGRVCLSRNHKDFRELHELVHEVRGVHLGIFVVRKDNDRKRDMSPHQIVTAIDKLLASGQTIVNEYHILNLWR
jgi:predicted nuclease of predicted toxin-antitoxin system